MPVGDYNWRVEISQVGIGMIGWVMRARVKNFSSCSLIKRACGDIVMTIIFYYWIILVRGRRERKL